MIYGCDLSDDNGYVDWDQLAPAIQFAIVRRGQGVRISDQQAQRNCQEARKRAIPLMHYWYIEAGPLPPLAQASVIVSALRDIQPGEPIGFDTEVNYAALTRDVAQMSRYLAATYGRPPLDYMDLDFLTRYNWQDVASLNVGLWLAHWDNQVEQTEQVAPFAFAAIKQRTAEGALPGVVGPVGLDVFYGTVDQFREYGAIPPT